VLDFRAVGTEWNGWQSRQPGGEWKSGGTWPPRITGAHCTHHYVCTVCMYSKRPSIVSEGPLLPKPPASRSVVCYQRSIAEMGAHCVVHHSCTYQCVCGTCACAWLCQRGGSLHNAGLTSGRCDKCLVVVLIECTCAVASLASDMCALALRRCAVCWSEPTTRQ